MGPIETSNLYMRTVCDICGKEKYRQCIANDYERHPMLGNRLINDLFFSDFEDSGFEVWTVHGEDYCICPDCSSRMIIAFDNVKHKIIGI